MIESDLIIKAKAGDAAAMDKLLTKYKFLAKAISRKYFLIGGEREDLAQEGMIGLYKAILSYSEEKGSFKSFARLCVESQIQSAVKSANRKKHHALNSFLSIDEESTQMLLPQHTPEQFLADKEHQEERFRKINENLSSLEKKVLKLYLEGLSYSEISESLNITSKSVDNAISRIKIKLKSKN